MIYSVFTFPDNTVSNIFDVVSGSLTAPGLKEFLIFVIGLEIFLFLISIFVR